MVAKVKLFRLLQTPASWSKKHKDRINEKKVKKSSIEMLASQRLFRFRLSCSDEKLTELLWVTVLFIYLIFYRPLKDLHKVKRNSF